VLWHRQACAAAQAGLCCGISRHVLPHRQARARPAIEQGAEATSLFGHFARCVQAGTRNQRVSSRQKQEVKEKESAIKRLEAARKRQEKVRAHV